jgi:acyl-CoA thioester hydrolase
MRTVYTCTFRIPDSAIDMNGHVGNLEYIRWMQEIATAHSGSEGWTIDRYRNLRTCWVVRSHHIEYLRPAYAGDVIDLHTWIADFGEWQSPRKYLFTKSGDPRIIVRAETVWVYVDAVTGRPKRTPEEFMTSFDVVAGEEEALRLAGKSRSG